MKIAVLTKTKRKENGNEQKHKYIHFHSKVSQDKRARTGVSIVISKNLKSSIKSWNPVNERLILVEFKYQKREMVVIGSYAPGEEASIQLKNEFVEQLTSLIKNTNPRKEIHEGLK